jgi:hypothetical protein
MPERFAIAVRWPDDSRPFLVHLCKPYFVAEVRRCGDEILFVSTLSTEHLHEWTQELDEILPAAVSYFSATLGLPSSTARFLKGNHGREFPRYLMAKTTSGVAFIVEPDHPSPLVEVRPPAPKAVSSSKLSSRFDTVTQWRLAQMRKYYQAFIDRQRSAEPASLVVPALNQPVS